MAQKKIYRLCAPRSLRVIVCCLTLILPVACAGVSAGDFCLIYEPVYTAAADTAMTVAACDRNNAAWWVLCAGGPVP